MPVRDGQDSYGNVREEIRSMRKGLILAGGTGTRLYPLTHALSKQLLPVYDKPLVYYPLCTLMLAGIREIQLIVTPRDKRAFETVLGDGSQWGLRFSYAVQHEPKGIAEALLLSEGFLDQQPAALILGDNIFYGQGLSERLQAVSIQQSGATVFAYAVRDPERYGVIEFDQRHVPVGIEEKPTEPKSNYAVTGLYFYDGRAAQHAHDLKPSARGELEITDLNRIYLQAGRLSVEILSRGVAWLDTGTHDALLDAATFIKVVEERQGLKIACPEEIAYRMGYIDAAQLLRLAQALDRNGYGAYLRRVLEGAADGHPHR
jgi:glucose-1-phosphate thymidylyltransferase